MKPKKKRNFIDKKNAVTYHLVHRSQRDPLQADEDAPQRVLLPEEAAKHVLQEEAAKKEEAKTFGVFFDDDYNYLQHLKSVNEIHDVEPVETFRIQSSKHDKSKEPQAFLPPELFASATENEVGMLNEAAPKGPQLDWDPDVIAALEDDFDHEDPDNELDDNFVVQAMADGEDGEDNDAVEPQALDRVAQFAAEQRLRFGGGEAVDAGTESDIGSDEADYSDDEFGSEVNFGDEETKSRFTSYSMTSSVIKRTEGLTLLDDRFEKLYEQYDEEQIGALDHEEIMGSVAQGSELLNNVLDDFEKTNKKITMKDVVQPCEDAEVVSASEDSDDLVEVDVEEPKEKWDCESILSTYSNLYNHPKMIQEPRKVKPIKLTKRLGIPAEVIEERGLTRKQQEKEEHLMSQLDAVPNFRPSDETTEEKKERKKAVKEERKVRRETKKSTKEAFKVEKKRQVKEMLNIRQAMTGVKIV